MAVDVKWKGSMVSYAVGIGETVARSAEATAPSLAVIVSTMGIRGRRGSLRREASTVVIVGGGGEDRAPVVAAAAALVGPPSACVG